MGIDARILVRVTGDKPTDYQISKWSDSICRSIGAKNFIISDGLPPAEYHAAYVAWRKTFESHPEYPVHTESVIAAIGKAPYQRRRAIELTNTIYPIDDEYGVPVEYREPGKCYLQDGNTIFANHNEWFLSVSLWTRYYGFGYERGDLLTICAVAEWCEENIPGCAVWYGGDSSGVCIEPFTKSRRIELRKHLYSQSGRDYFNYRGLAVRHPRPCGLCVDGGSFSQYGFGQNYIAVHCSGCGKSFETRDNAETWKGVEDLK